MNEDAVGDAVMGWAGDNVPRITEDDVRERSVNALRRTERAGALLREARAGRLGSLVEPEALAFAIAWFFMDQTNCVGGKHALAHAALRTVWTGAASRQETTVGKLAARHACDLPRDTRDEKCVVAAGDRTLAALRDPFRGLLTVDDLDGLYGTVVEDRLLRNRGAEDGLALLPELARAATGEKVLLLRDEPLLLDVADRRLRRVPKEFVVRDELMLF